MLLDVWSILLKMGEGYNKPEIKDLIRSPVLGFTYNMLNGVERVVTHSLSHNLNVLFTSPVLTNSLKLHIL